MGPGHRAPEARAPHSCTADHREVRGAPRACDAPAGSDAGPEVKKYVSFGAGPRASQYLVLGAKARAAMDGRPVPDIDDVRAVALSVLRHRVVMNFQGEAEGVSVEKLLPLNEKR